METVSTGNRTTITYAVSAALALLTSMVSAEMLTPICAVLIALLGVPHGSLDLHLLSTKAQRYREVLLYGAGIVMVLLLWYASPTLMFVLFLANSAWHFGDCDIETQSTWRPLLAIIYGVSILLVIVNPFDPSVTWIVQDLTGHRVDAIAQNHVQIARYVAALVVLTYPLATRLSHPRPALIRGVLIVLVAASVPSLVAFTWYFCVVHAWTSMDRLRHHLDHVHPWSWARTVRAAAPLTLLTYVGIAIAGYVVSSTAVITMLFIALSALTVPHSRLFHRVYA